MFAFGDIKTVSCDLFRHQKVEMSTGEQMDRKIIP